MEKKHESKCKIEDPSDPDIYDAIRYLEPEQTVASERNDDTTLVICFCVVILLLGFLGFMCLYYR